MDTNNINRFATHGDGKFSAADFNKIGDNVIFENGVLVFHPENISLGSNIYIGHNTILKGYYKNQMIIGDNTWIGQNCFFHSAGGIKIGNGVGIGPSVKIITSYHKDNEPNKPILACKLEFKEVVLEDGCDIGIGAVILPGIIVGEGAIIGAGSIVTKNVAPYTVVAGSPARFIKRRK